MRTVSFLLLCIGSVHTQWQPPPPAPAQQTQQQYYAQPGTPQQLNSGRNAGQEPPRNQPVPPQTPNSAQDDYSGSLSPPSLKFKIGIVSGKAKGLNRDENTGKFKSNLRVGSLYFTNNKNDPTHPNITVEFVEGKGDYPLESGFNYGGKGFQLSTLNVFNEKLFSCDSKTGIVYELRRLEAEKATTPTAPGPNYEQPLPPAPPTPPGRNYEQPLPPAPPTPPGRNYEQPLPPAPPTPPGRNYEQPIPPAPPKPPGRYYEQPLPPVTPAPPGRYYEPPFPRQGRERRHAAQAKTTYKDLAQPWILLTNENTNKPFKCEWGIVRDNKLWLGSTGSLVNKNEQKPHIKKRHEGDAEFDSGEFHDNTASGYGLTPEYSKERQVVKRIDIDGQVESVDFSKHYDVIAKAYQVDLTKGHVIHEAAEFSELTGQWTFIPRRVTKEKKNKQTWPFLSPNFGVAAIDSFETWISVPFGKPNQNFGVVGLRYIPGTQDKFLLALKTGVNEQGRELSSLVVYDETGYEILAETPSIEGTFSAVEFL